MRSSDAREKAMGERAHKAIGELEGRLVAYFYRKGVRHDCDQEDMIAETQLKVFRALLANGSENSKWKELHDAPLVWRCARQVLDETKRRPNREYTNQVHLESDGDRPVEYTSTPTGLINSMLRRLSKDDAELIRRIRLAGERRLAIASEFGVSPGHVSRLEKRILNRLRTIASSLQVT